MAASGWERYLSIFPKRIAETGNTYIALFHGLRLMIVGPSVHLSQPSLHTQSAT